MSERELLPQFLDETADLLIEEWDHFERQPLAFWRGRWYRLEVDGVWYLRSNDWVEKEFAGRLKNCDYMKVMPDGRVKRIPFPTKANSTGIRDFVSLMAWLAWKLAVAEPMIGKIKSNESAEPSVHRHAKEEWLKVHRARNNPLTFRCGECKAVRKSRCFNRNSNGVPIPADTHEERWFTVWHAERSRQVAALQYANEATRAYLLDELPPPLGEKSPSSEPPNPKEADCEGVIPISWKKDAWLPSGVPWVFYKQIMRNDRSIPISTQKPLINEAYREIGKICADRHLVAFCRVSPWNFTASTLPDVEYTGIQLSVMRKPVSNPKIPTFDVLIIPTGMHGYGKREKDLLVHKGVGYRVISPPANAYARRRYATSPP